VPSTSRASLSWHIRRRSAYATRPITARDTPMLKPAIAPTESPAAVCSRDERSGRLGGAYDGVAGCGGGDSGGSGVDGGKGGGTHGGNGGGLVGGICGGSGGDGGDNGDTGGGAGGNDGDGDEGGDAGGSGGGCGGSGGGSGGNMLRGPQSMQSVPRAQLLKTLWLPPDRNVPPSSHHPSDAVGHVFVHQVGVNGGGGGGCTGSGGGGGEGGRIVRRPQSVQS